MSSERKEIKARLLKGYEALIDKMLEEKPANDEIMLEDIEQAAIQVGERAKQQITQILSDEATTSEPRCPTCGRRAPMKDYREKQVITEAGEVTLRRAYHYCDTCRKGFFPPG
jgi:uncharacterized protein with PIN domain